MAATIRIDQVGLPVGTDGQSRTDGLDNGAEVTLTNTNAQATTTTFELLWVPLGDTTAVASLAEQSPNVWTFTPTAAAYGTYLVLLTENAGTASARTERRILGVRTPTRSLLIPALNEIADPQANISTPIAGAVTENSDDNSQDYSDALLNDLPFAGWWRKLHELFLAVEAGGGGGNPSIGNNRFNRSNGAGGWLDTTLSWDIAREIIIGQASLNGEQGFQLNKSDTTAAATFNYDENIATLNLASGFGVDLNVTGLQNVSINAVTSLALSIGGSLGAPGNILTTDGSVATWQAPSGGAPGGINTSIQYNDGGSFGGSANFQWDEAARTFLIQGLPGGTFDALELDTISFTGTGSNGDQWQAVDFNLVTFTGNFDPSATWQVDGFASINLFGNGVAGDSITINSFQNITQQGFFDGTGTRTVEGFNFLEFDGDGTGAGVLVFGNTDPFNSIGFTGQGSGASWSVFDFETISFSNVDNVSIGGGAGTGTFSVGTFENVFFQLSGAVGSQFNVNAVENVAFNPGGTNTNRTFNANSFHLFSFSGTSVAGSQFNLNGFQSINGSAGLAGGAWNFSGFDSASLSSTTGGMFLSSGANMDLIATTQLVLQGTSEVRISGGRKYALDVSGGDEELAATDLVTGAVALSGGTLTLTTPNITDGDIVDYLVEIDTRTGGGRDVFRGRVSAINIGGVVTLLDVTPFVSFNQPLYAFSAAPNATAVDLVVTNNDTIAIDNARILITKKVRAQA